MKTTKEEQLRPKLRTFCEQFEEEEFPKTLGKVVIVLLQTTTFPN